MYLINRELRQNGVRFGDVIELDAIVRSLHLVPKFPKSSDIPEEWKSENVLELCNSFYVNCFWEKEIYQAVY